MAVHWEAIARLAKAHQIEPRTDSEETLERFLKRWWCIQYNRPFKDPLLSEYTVDELAYEFLAHHYIKNDPKEIVEAERRKAQDDEWIRKQLEQAAAKPEAAPPDRRKLDSPDPIETSIRFDG